MPEHRETCTPPINSENTFENTKLWPVKRIAIPLKKDSTLVNLVGQKRSISCYIQRKKTQALWDTGSQVSGVDEAWKAENIPDVKLVDIAEIVNLGEREGFH